MHFLLEPILFGQILVALIAASRRQHYRASFVKSVVLFFAFVAVSTEALSALSLLTANVVVGWWLTADLAMLGYLFYKYGVRRSEVLHAVKKIRERSERWSAPLTHKLLIGILFVVYSIVFLAAFTVPTTGDSMTYHLARVAHWAQNANVAFYPTPILRQLYQNPLAEYAILHLQLLSGDDHLANLVQYGCFIGCAVTASLIAKEFKLSRTMQLLAAVVCATTPMAILQGSSTQNDLVVSLFAMLFLYFAIRAVRSHHRYEIVFAGLSLGLALLSKGTAIPYCLPIGVFVFGRAFIVNFSKKRALKLAGSVAFVVVLAAALNVGHYVRNYQLFGAPVSSGDDVVANKNITLQMVGSNLLRNYALHLGSLSDSSTKSFEALVRSTLGNELNNPDSSYLGHEFYIPNTVHEDTVGNMLQIILLSIACLAAFACARNQRRTVLISALSIIAGFTIYCVLLRWQPWASRLHLPLFMLGAPLIAWFVSRYKARGAAAVAVLSFAAAVSPLFWGKPSLLMPYQDRWTANRFFSQNPDIGAAFAAAAFYLERTEAREIGLDLSVDYAKNYELRDWEYPYWVMVRNASGERPGFRHVGVANVSSRLEDGRPLPEWIISTTDESVFGGVRYTEVFNNRPIRILRREPAADAGQ
jgi:hypothetical protein